MSDQLLSVLMTVIGAEVTRIRRIFFVVDGVANTSAGAIELGLRDGRAVVMDSGPDGECLTVVDGAWTDPFSPCQMSSEDLECIAMFGRWMAFDLSLDEDYSDLIGAQVEAVRPLHGHDGKVVGAVLRVGDEELKVDVEGDDVLVEFNP